MSPSKRPTQLSSITALLAHELDQPQRTLTNKFEASKSKTFRTFDNPIDEASSNL